MLVYPVFLILGRLYFYLQKHFDLYTYPNDHPNISIAVLVIGTIIVFSGAAFLTRRLHDSGFSGKWSLFILALALLTGFPQVMFFYCLALLLIPGDERVNKYGPPYYRLKKIGKKFILGEISVEQFNQQRQQLLSP